MLAAAAGAAAAAGVADAADKSPRGSTPPPPQQPRDLSPDFSGIAPASGVYRVAENGRVMLVTAKSQKSTGGPWAQVVMDAGVNWYLAFPQSEIVKRDSGDRIRMDNLMDKEYEHYRKITVERYNETLQGEKARALEVLGVPEKINVEFTFPQIIRQVLFMSTISPPVAVRIYLQRDNGEIECPDSSHTNINQVGYTVRDPEPVSLLFTMDLTTMTPNYKILKFFEQEPKSQEF
jgi:hypothetical protein